MNVHACPERWGMPRPSKNSRSGGALVDPVVGVLFIAGELGLVTFKGPFQLNQFYDLGVPHTDPGLSNHSAHLSAPWSVLSTHWEGRISLK